MAERRPATGIVTVEWVDMSDLTDLNAEPRFALQVSWDRLLPADQFAALLRNAAALVEDESD